MSGDEIRRQQVAEAEDEPYLPVPYVTEFTNQTATIKPLVLTSVRAWIIAMLEWSSLKFIDKAPTSVWIASSVIAAIAWVIFENQNWLNFKNRRYFPVSMTLLFVTWVCITAYGYYTIDTPNAVASNLQSQLSAMTKERDAARQERDAAVRIKQEGRAAQSAQAPTPQSPPAPEDPNQYPELNRARERALVDELANARDVLGVVQILSADGHNDAANYRNSLMVLFNRAIIPAVAGGLPMSSPHQAGVMVALADLNKPSPAAKKILEILTDTGLRPRVIQGKPTQGDYYIFIGPLPL
jgi:hypothetical protein